MLAPVFPALPTGDVPASLLHMALRVGPAVVDVASLLVKSSSGNGTGTGTGTADKRTTILATLTGAWNVPLPNARLSVDVRGTMEHVDDIIALLDAGIQRVLVDRLSSDTARALYERGVPADRVMARRVDNWTDVDMAVDEERIVGTIVSATSSAGSDFARLPSTTIFECTADSAMSLSELSTLTSSIATADILLPVARVSISGDTESSAAEKTKLDLISTWISMLKTDRQDGLYPTVVVDERDTALGLVYSSRASLCEAVRTGAGVYYSRSRCGLWRKGETSGARQVLHRFEVDCDGDALKAVVTQVAPGFCHLNRRSCFGNAAGIGALAETLKSRLDNPLPGSYTNKLFTDDALLHAKIEEEAKELCEATTKDDIAWETADLIYFALAKCVKAGVTIDDVERHLNMRALKVTRRPGLAKVPLPGSANGAPPPAKSVEPPASSAESTQWQLLRVHDSASISPALRDALLHRPIMDTATITARVEPIVKAVRERGDAALIELTAKFDGVHLPSPILRAPFAKEILEQVQPHVRAAIDVAYGNIERFHQAQLPSVQGGSNDDDAAEPGELRVETMPGVVCSRFSRPIERVGLYVPGGSAVLPSTAMMLGIPAKVAGCQRIIIATPPRKDGSVCPEVAYVAQKVGAEMIVLAGGAQAVAAMAYGTESVPKVDKICGPGNQYVTAAKMLAQNDPACLVSIDMPAGPSEVIADETSNPVFVASDLLSQAEHGPDSQVVLLTVNVTATHLASIQEQVRLQTLELPRADIVRVSLSKSFILCCTDDTDAMDFSNAYAPEHLILHTRDPRALMKRVRNAGSVFLGPYSPESCGDYASGTNHTLPTYGYARMYSGVNTDTFLKYITAQELSVEGLDRLGDAVVTLAEVEELHGHRNAVLLRLKEIRGQ